MLRLLLTAWLHDVSTYLKAPGKGLASEYPAVFIAYFKNYGQDRVLTEVRESLRFLTEGVRPSANNELFNAFCTWLRSEASTILETQKMSAQNPTSHARQAISSTIEKNNSARLLSAITRFNQALNPLMNITVQIPTALPHNLRGTIRERLATDYPGYTVLFTVQPEILGGLRIFKDGGMIDLSWRGQIHSLMR